MNTVNLFPVSVSHASCPPAPSSATTQGHVPGSAPYVCGGRELEMLCLWQRKTHIHLQPALALDIFLLFVKLDSISLQSVTCSVGLFLIVNHSVTMNVFFITEEEYRAHHSNLSSTWSVVSQRPASLGRCGPHCMCRLGTGPETGPNRPSVLLELPCC